jgi:hypothetical protein
MYHLVVGRVTEDTFIIRPEGKEESDPYAYREITEPGFGSLCGREDMIRRVRGEVIDRLGRNAIKSALGGRAYIK